VEKNQLRSLYLYVGLAYLITWFFWITAFLLGYKDISFMNILSWDFNNQSSVISFLIFRLGVYGPIISSFVITYYFFKLEGIKDLWQRITKWKVEVKWYLYMLFIPILINLIVVLVGIIIGIPFNSFFKSEFPLSIILIYFLYQIFTSGMEEPGWRGFLLEKLQKIYTAEKSSWILGLIWAVWHYPYLLFLYSNLDLISIIFSIVGFTMAIIGQTFIITWFYNNTKSVLITILLHAWLNTSTTYILGNLTITNPIMGVIPALVTWGIVFILLKKYGGKTLTT
jgi:membrane protease YdiL (CAAX protease family)